MSSQTCSTDCIFSIIIVGFLWGATNPFLRSGTQSSVAKNNKGKKTKENEKAKTGLHRLLDIITSPLHCLASLFINWRFLLPFAINQSGSILFHLLVSRFPVSVVVPSVNGLQFVSTAVVGSFLGEAPMSRRASLGCLMTVTGVVMMMASDLYHPEISMSS